MSWRTKRRVLRNQMDRNGVEIWCGRAYFQDQHVVCVQSVGTSERCVTGEHIVIATGSRPRTPGNVSVDHEHVLDSDSILSLIYLPESLLILGGGVIACEFASVFAALGVKVTMVDNHTPPPWLLGPRAIVRVRRSVRGRGRALPR